MTYVKFVMRKRSILHMNLEVMLSKTRKIDDCFKNHIWFSSSVPQREKHF
jgi:hypothetical protein